jgi:hypothetical protein
MNVARVIGVEFFDRFFCLFLWRLLRKPVDVMRLKAAI